MPGWNQNRSWDHPEPPIFGVHPDCWAVSSPSLWGENKLPELRLRVETVTGRTCVVGFVHGSCSSEASRRCSGLNKHVNFRFCLFLTGVRVVPEPTDTSTTTVSGTEVVRRVRILPCLSFLQAPFHTGMASTDKIAQVQAMVGSLPF